jgi:(R,R)-butanediol dehydrogenase/meso-butanediol dehydrogenase/diacetyl reductase
MGATDVIYLNEGDPVERLQELTGGLGADVTLECVGRPDTPQMAVDLTRRHGTVVIVGVFAQPGTVDFNTLMFTEKSLLGSSIYIDEGRTAIELMADGRIDPAPLVTSIVPLENGADGFARLLDDKENNIKVLLRIP